MREGLLAKYMQCIVRCSTHLLDLALYPQRTNGPIECVEIACEGNDRGSGRSVEL